MELSNLRGTGLNGWAGIPKGKAKKSKNELIVFNPTNGAVVSVVHICCDQSGERPDGYDPVFARVAMNHTVGELAAVYEQMNPG
jgi:inosine/xanthosine triphosphate pyrophosphatase family protein